MCGILVIYSKKNKLKKNECLGSLNELYNRGPDKFLYKFFNNKLFIGNSILNITGNIKKNKGLYRSKNKKIFISFNGEIYNYKLLKKKYKGIKNSNYNDTEVLVNLHEKENIKNIFKSLDGMYAYTIYDIKKDNLIFVSDPQGEKKLFKFENEEFLIISSNIRSIKVFLKKNLKLNYEIFKTYFKTRHFLHLNNTIYKDILYLKPGHIHEYNIKKENFTISYVEDPVSWISKKKYFYYKTIGFQKTSEMLKKIIVEKLELMTPKKKFGTVCSGGVDSTLISYYLKDKINNNFFLCINHKGKDVVADLIYNFNKYLNFKKFKLISIDLKKYYNNLRSTYRNFGFPLLTHDLVGRLEIFKFFKKKKTKICFTGDGADEIFGGYSMYEKINWQNKKIENQSGYSKIIAPNIYSNEIYSRELWYRAFYKYNEFLPKIESKIQASLFTDYFIQSIGVHNISNDILAGEKSVEVRNVFFNKDILKFGINLPLNYKLDLKNKNSLFKTKKILKKLFVDEFGIENLQRKKGFAGFPNETIFLLDKKNKSKFLKICKNLKKYLTLTKENEWKILNLFYYNKYLNNKFDITKLFGSN